MATENQQTRNTRFRKKRRPKQEGAVMLTRQPGQPTGLTQLPAQPGQAEVTDRQVVSQALLQRFGSMSDGSSIEDQAALLSNSRLQAAQQQDLVARLGRVQGNQQVQRLIVQMKQSQPVPSPVPSPQNETGDQSISLADLIARETLQLSPDAEPRSGLAAKAGKMEAGQEHQVVQADREENETPWGSTYISVEVKPIPNLIGNLSPASTGNHQINFAYGGRLAYKGDAYAGIDGPDGKPVSSGGRASLTEALQFNKTVRSTAPGGYKAYLGNRGGTFAAALRAEESFSVVNPVELNPTPRTSRILYDFNNPIPLQIEGATEVKFQLMANHVRSKRVGVSAGGSSSNSVSDKVTFGLSLGLDNDKGAKGSGELGFSTETRDTWQEQWKREQSNLQEIAGSEWKSETFKPGPKEKANSKMIIPLYEWKEFEANIYPHDPATLRVKGDRKSVVVGMLRPTGSFMTVVSTDPGLYSDSDPTEAAQVEPDQLEEGKGRQKEQYNEQMAARGNWRTLPGARFGNDTFQFIQGPVAMKPADRDYGMQDGERIHPGTGTVTTGLDRSLMVQDGMTFSSSEDSSHVTTNNESKSLAASIGKKGLGSIGDKLAFENSNSISSGTNTGLSTAVTDTEKTQIQISQSVAKKLKQNQYIIFTPLVNHKVFKVAYGAQQPADGSNTVDPDKAGQVIYIHTYQHQPIPHIKLIDLRSPVKGNKPPLGSSDWPAYTEV